MLAFVNDRACVNEKEKKIKDLFKKVREKKKIVKNEY